MTSADKREHPRVNRRIPVRYWLRSDPEKVFAGYTKDVSEGGCYVTTNRAFKEGSRLRLEFMTERGSFVLEGRVARSKSYPRELQRIKTGGMGIRFFTVPELMREVITVETQDAESEDSDLTGTQPMHVETVRQASVQDAARATVETDDEETAAHRRSRAWRTGELRARRGKQELGTKAPPTFPVRFATADEYRDAFHRDLRYGGLFVSTTAPASLDESVELLVEIEDVDLNVRILARVVHVHDHDPAHAGMGVQVSDPGALDKLSQLANES